MHSLSLEIATKIYSDRRVDAIAIRRAKIIDVALSENLEPNQLHLEFLDAYQLYRNSEFERALEQFMLLLQQCEDLNELILSQYIRVHIGTIYAIMSNFPRALHFFLTAEKSQYHHDYAFDALLQINLADTYIRLEKYTSAIEHAQLALDVINHLDDDSSHALAAMNIGTAYRMLGDLSQAEEWFHKALSVATRGQCPRSIPLSMQCLAQLEAQKGNSETAEKYFLKCMEDFQNIGDPDSLVGTGVAYLNFLYDMNRYEEALSYCERILAMPYASADVIKMFQTYRVKALSLQALGQQENAQKIIEVQLAYAEEQLKKSRSRELSYFDSALKLGRQQKSKNNAEVVSSYLESLNHLGQKMATSPDLQADLPVIFEDIQNILPASFLSIAFYLPETNQLNYAHIIEDEGIVEPFTVSCDNVDRLGVYCCRYRKTILLNTSSESEIQPYLETDRIDLWIGNKDSCSRSALYTPILLNDELLGMISTQHVDSYVYKHYHKQLLEQLARYIAVAVKNIKQRQELIKKQIALELTNQKLAYISKIDPLTKALNRHELDKLAPRFILHSEEQNVPLSSMMIDIDYYKGYNDYYGHDAGDNILRQLASIFQKGLNEQTDYLFRYGGDEFFVLMLNSDEQEVLAMAHRVQELVREAEIEHKTSPISDFVTLTVGVQTCYCQEEEGTDLSVLIQRTDLALYQGKRDNRNTVSAFKMMGT
ncbi:diguanylate cyclase [Vibrio sp. Of7-15]|uniref:diguanylate cyclase n=1 Tax=Vibrio sp. Of7-15 TaxID=2724879 RepID=UPI001EF26B17|nr:diguanylate cyclase [Vibrio sp. Of7-15]MCG7499428.1 diguanylate cyclase [Vibrio sp. Of7-15]